MVETFEMLFITFGYMVDDFTVLYEIREQMEREQNQLSLFD